MKKITYISLLLLLCFTVTGCSFIEGALKKIPFFEDADLDALTEKAEKAWEEVGKNALNDAVDSAKDAILGNNETLWPKNDITKDIPDVQHGTISKITEKDSFCEIVVTEISQEAYQKYISELSNALGAPHESGMHRMDNRLVYTQYNKDTTTLVVTISAIKVVAPPSSEAESNSSSEETTLSEEQSEQSSSKAS